MIRILHLAYDEKFIDFAIESFNSCEGVISEFKIIPLDASRQLKYVKSVGAENVIDASYLGSKEALSDLKKADALVVHYLGMPGVKLILRAPRDLPIGWRGWGGDYYDLLPDLDRDQLLGPATRATLAGLPIRQSATQALGRQIRKVRRRWYVLPLFRRAVRRVTVFSAPVRADVQTVERALGGSFRADYAQLNYKSVERSFSVGDVSSDASTILVGNSSTATNNHADVFSLLTRAGLCDRDVVVPLMYGDMMYRDLVLGIGRRDFGDRFHPLTEFLPQSSYNAKISQCGIAIMGHRRQQGLGNVGTLLYGGARIFFDPVNPIYKELANHGAVIGTLDDIERLGARALVPLTAQERRLNKDVTEKLWSARVVAANTKAFVERLLSGRRRRM